MFEIRWTLGVGHEVKSFTVENKREAEKAIQRIADLGCILISSKEVI